MNNNNLGSRLIGNWKVNAIVTLQTGEPFNVTATNVSDTGGNSASYANCIGNPLLVRQRVRAAYVGVHATGFFVNPAAFSAQRWAHSVRAGPEHIPRAGSRRMRISVYSNLFPITEADKIEMRFEFFDAFNHASFGNPAANISTSGANFGKVTITTAGPRIMQIAIKYYF